MNKKVTIILIALLSFTAESYGAASFAAQKAMAAQATVAGAAEAAETIPSKKERDFKKTQQRYQATADSVPIDEKNIKVARKFHLPLYQTQDFLIPKIMFYLEKQLAKEFDRVKKDEAIKFFEQVFKYEGVCGGLTALWLFASLTTDREVTKALAATDCFLYETPLKCLKSVREQVARISAKTFSKDDLAWFYYVQDLLLNWDGIRELDAVENNHIDRFINLVMSFQLFSGQLFRAAPKYMPISFARSLETIKYVFNKNTESKPFDLSVALETTTGVKAVSKFPRTRFWFSSKERLIRFLEEHIAPETMIFFLANDGLNGAHITGLYQRSFDKVITFYDPSSLGVSCEFKPTELNLLVDEIRESFSNSRTSFIMIDIEGFTLEKSAPKQITKDIQDWKIALEIDAREQNIQSLQIDKLLQIDDQKKFVFIESKIPGFSLYKNKRGIDSIHYLCVNNKKFPYSRYQIAALYRALAELFFKEFCENDIDLDANLKKDVMDFMVQQFNLDTFMIDTLNNCIDGLIKEKNNFSQFYTPELSLAFKQEFFEEEERLIEKLIKEALEKRQ